MFFRMRGCSRIIKCVAICATADLCEKLDNMVSYVDFIEERSPQIIIEYRARLEEKLRELLADNQLDDSRIAQEVTIFADKICVDEETGPAGKRQSEPVYPAGFSGAVC